ncbi:hypothetical protein GCM10007422_11700 [Pedobacter zeae]|nr:hypothetical protein GCM10007422_11700 [Pedobacter zeae]
MILDLIEKDGKVKFQFAFPTAKELGYFNKNHKSILRHLKCLENNVKKKLNEKVRKLEAFIINELKTNHASDIEKGK